jgi:hypothetical protein
MWRCVLDSDSGQGKSYSFRGCLFDLRQQKSSNLPWVLLDLCIYCNISAARTAQHQKVEWLLMTTWKYGKRLSYACNRPWRPMLLQAIEAPTFSRQSAHKWQWCCQAYAPASIHPQEDSWYSFLLRGSVDPRTVMWLEGLGQPKNHRELSPWPSGL